MDNFFKHFPLVGYGNNIANTVSVNLMAKIAFQKTIQQNYEIFHPYTIQDGDRADTIANYYYGDPGYDWIVYFSNNIIDPYYDWYMNSESFKKFIIEKYGSLTSAKRNIKFFRTNYVSDDSMISVAAYEALSENQKRFWAPVVGSYNNVVRYERKKEDVIFKTNKTQQLSISLVGNTNFQVNEYIYQTSGGVTISSGTVNYSNSSVCVISNVGGSISNTYNILGGDSGANATISTVNTITTSIDTDIQQYFESVSFYEYENEINEQKKNIRLIDVSYVSSIEKEFKKLLSS